MADDRADDRAGVPRRLPGEVPRRTALGRISAEAQLIKVVAPSGYGKTTLLAQLARRHRGPVVWLTATAGHAMTSRLAADLAAAAERAVPGLRCRRTRTALAAEAPATSLAGALGRDLAPTREPLLIVLDQTQHVGADGDELLVSLALQLGAGHRLARAGYDCDPGTVAQPLADGRAVLLTAAELAFDEAETAAYLRARGSDLPAAEVHRRLDGWPIGIGLSIAGEPLGAGPDLLVRAVLDAVPAALRAVLPAAAVLEVWSEDGAAELDLLLPAGWVGAVRAAGMPGTVLGDGSFRPHTLVRSTLDADLRQQPDRHRQAHRAAADRCEGGDDLIGALRHRLAAGDHDAATALAARLVPELRARQQHRLVRSLLEELPALSPELAAYLGHAQVETGAIREGEGTLLRLHARRHGAGLVHFALGRLAARRGDASAALRLAEDGLTAARLDDVPDRSAADRLVAALLERNRFYALALLGRTGEAVRLGREQAAREEAAGDRLALAQTLQYLEEVFGEAGDWAAREDAILRALAIFEDYELSETNGGLHLSYGLAELLLLRGEWEQAERTIERARGAVSRVGGPMEPLLLARLGQLRAAQQCHREAADLLSRAIPAAQRAGMSMFAQQARYELAPIALLAGENERALETVAEAGRRWDGEYVSMGPLRDLCLGIVAVHGPDDDPGRARRLLQGAADGLPPADRLRAVAHLLELDRREGRLPGTAWADLTAAAKSAGGWGGVRAHLPMLEAVLREALRGASPADDTAELTGLLGDTSSGRPRRQVLALRSLGGFAASVDGVPVRLPSARAQELLVWLAVHGPASRARIADALWDGSREQRHLEHTKTLVRRLRAALSGVTGTDPLPNREHLFGLAPELVVRLDLTEVLDSLAAGPDRARAALNRCATFLPAAESEWVGRQRTARAAAAAAAAIDVLTDPLPDLDGAGADRLAAAALALDPLAVDVHRARVGFFRRRGEPAALRRAEADLRRAVAELGPDDGPGPAAVRRRPRSVSPTPG